MESSESEAIFDSLKLNPQLFFNEALNTVDDLIDDAFDFFHQEASTNLRIEGTVKSDDLARGIKHIHSIVQSAVDKRLDLWEKYCLRRCFTLPEGFSLAKKSEATPDFSLFQDALDEPDLDAQLESLRDKLNAVGKESAELTQELQSLERQSASSDHSARLVNELSEMYDENSMNDMFQDLVKAALELRTKMDKWKTGRIKDVQHFTIENPNGDPLVMFCNKGLMTKLVEVQNFIGDIDNM